MTKIPSGREARPGVISAGHLDANGLKQAKAEGVAAVVDLCPLAERGYDEAPIVESLGMAYVRIPIGGPQDLGSEAALQLKQALASVGDKPVLIHCATGNRVGALLALEAYLHEKASAADALALGRRAGLLSLEPKVTHLLGHLAPES